MYIYLSFLFNEKKWKVDYSSFDCDFYLRICVSNVALTLQLWKRL